MSKKPTPREVIQAELDTKEIELAALSAERGNFPDIPRGVIATADLAGPRRGEVLRLIGAVEGRINSLKDQLAALDKAEAFALAGKSCTDDVIQAESLLSTAAAAASRLVHRRDQVIAKADHFRGASAAQLEMARASEQSAIAAYARAVSAGDEVEQAAAQANIAAAQNDVADAQRSAATQSTLIAALDAEVAALDKELAAVGDQAEAARKALCTALQAMYAAQWERAVDELVEVGARYCETYKLRGSYYSGFDRLTIPRFDPARGMARFDRLPSVDFPSLDSKTRENLAVLFTATGRGRFAANKDS